MGLEHKVGKASKDNESRRGKRSIKYGRLIPGIEFTAYGLVSTFAGMYLGMESIMEFDLQPSLMNTIELAMDVGIIYFGLRIFSGGMDLIKDAFSDRNNSRD